MVSIASGDPNDFRIAAFMVISVFGKEDHFRRLSGRRKAWYYPRTGKSSQVVLLNKSSVAGERVQSWRIRVEVNSVIS